MILLRVYFLDGGWWAEWLAGCDIVLEGPMTFAQAMIMEDLF